MFLSIQNMKIRNGFVGRTEFINTSSDSESGCFCLKATILMLFGWKRQNRVFLFWW